MLTSTTSSAALFLSAAVALLSCGHELGEPVAAHQQQPIVKLATTDKSWKLVALAHDHSHVVETYHRVAESTNAQPDLIEVQAFAGDATFDKYTDPALLHDRLRRHLERVTLKILASSNTYTFCEWSGSEPETNRVRSGLVLIRAAYPGTTSGPFADGRVRVVIGYAPRSGILNEDDWLDLYPVFFDSEFLKIGELITVPTEPLPVPGLADLAAVR